MKRGTVAAASPSRPRPWATSTPGAGSGDKRPSLTKVIGTLKHAIDKLQLAQGLEAEQARQATLSNYIGQVELLQTAFTSLADAVLEELDTLAAERLKVQREQSAWAQALRELDDSVQAKLGALTRLEERLDRKLAVAAQLPGQFEALARQQATGSAGLEGLNKDVKRLQLQLGQLERSQAMAASEVAVAPLNPIQLAKVKECALDQLQHVPALVSAGVNRVVPAMIEEAMEAGCHSLRQDVSATTELLAADIARLAQADAGTRGDMAALAGALQQQQAALGRLEASEAANPRASLRLVTALEGKVDSLAAQHALQDKAARQLEGLAQLQQAQITDTKEALLRSAKVFASLLKVPSPVSGTLWSCSPGRAGLATAGSPTRSSASAVGGGGSPLGGKYSALLSGLL